MSPDVQILRHDLKRQDKVYLLTRCPERACVPMLRTARGLLILFTLTAVALLVLARHVRQSDAHARRLSGSVVRSCLCSPTPVSTERDRPVVLLGRRPCRRSKVFSLEFLLASSGMVAIMAG